MIVTTVLAPVASGLLTTTNLDDSVAKVMCLLGFLGLATGIGLQVSVCGSLFLCITTNHCIYNRPHLWLYRQR